MIIYLNATCTLYFCSDWGVLFLWVLNLKQREHKSAEQAVELSYIECRRACLNVRQYDVVMDAWVLFADQICQTMWAVN